MIETNPQKVDIIMAKLQTKTKSFGYGEWEYDVRDDGSVDINFWDVASANYPFAHCFDNALPVKFNIITGNFSVAHCRLNSLEGCPNEISGDCNLSYNPKLQSLRYLPLYARRIIMLDPPTIKAIDPFEYKWGLLCKTQFYGFGSNKYEENLLEILNSGRVDGIMPSELIPGKIRQLKEMQ